MSTETTAPAALDAKMEARRIANEKKDAAWRKHEEASAAIRKAEAEIKAATAIIAAARAAQKEASEAIFEANRAFMATVDKLPRPTTLAAHWR